MNDMVRIDLPSARDRDWRNATAALSRVLAQQCIYICVSAVLIISLWITVGSISRSYLIGKLASPMTHNDVNYLIVGIHRLLYIELNGFWAEFLRLYRNVLHAPISDYQAALAFSLFGFHDWAPYATNIIYLFIFFGASVWLLRGTPDVIVIAVLLAMAGMPLLVSTISEFAPEIPCGLFSALGVLLTLRINALDRSFGPRALAGLCFGLGFLGKPSSFIYVPAIACATLGLAFLRDVIWPRAWKQFAKGVYLGILHLFLSLWLPAIYVIPWWDHFAGYFYLAMFDAANVKAFGGQGHFWQQDPLFYLTGPAGEYMFGNFLWAYVGTIALGIAAATTRNDHKYIARQIELLVMVLIMWLPPTASQAKNSMFGTPFGYLLAFMVVMALRSIHETLGRRLGATVVPLLSLFLLVSPTSRYTLPNTPGFYWNDTDAPIVEEKWIEAMKRFTTVILGNAPIYHSGSVYITDPGYYHIPVLDYAFLKKDPSLRWSFMSLWEDSDPKAHMDYIHQNKEEFVIAGQGGDGLSYPPPLIAGAAGSAATVLSALWKDPEYMPIDQYYGPGGRTITIFQRSTAYAGWRPVSGLQNTGTMKPWLSTGNVVYIQAYAPTPVSGKLKIDATGPVGERIDVIVNGDHVRRLAFGSDGKASLNQALNLIAGQNDIVLQRSDGAAVEFDRLLVIRNIVRQE